MLEGTLKPDIAISGSSLGIWRPDVLFAGLTVTKDCFFPPFGCSGAYDTGYFSIIRRDQIYDVWKSLDVRSSSPDDVREALAVTKDFDVFYPVPLATFDVWEEMVNERGNDLSQDGKWKVVVGPGCPGLRSGSFWKMARVCLRERSSGFSFMIESHHRLNPIGVTEMNAEEVDDYFFEVDAMDVVLWTLGVEYPAHAPALLAVSRMRNEHRRMLEAQLSPPEH
jgi:hypothetical protein